MELWIFQKGFNFSQDGPGNRLVYHLQGCNMRCPWCSNPEGLPVTGGQRWAVDTLVEEVMRSRMMFFEGGGVTLTGGEIGMQLPAVRMLLEQLHERGIDTAVETNGTSPDLETLFPVLDHLILDCKHHDEQRHRQVTGVSCAQTWKNLQKATKWYREVSVRIPVIGGFNASETDAMEFSKLFHQLGVEKHITIELLAYHEYGKEKYARLGLPYTMTDQARVSAALIRTMETILTSNGLKVIRT